MERRPPLAIPAPPPLLPPPGFDARLAALGAPVDARVLAQVGDYLARLVAMNPQVNLTAVDDPQEVWEKHALDALALLPLLAELPRGARVVDVGSGGGLPGIPLAIARPELRFTLVDSIQKKAAFLQGVAAAMRLTNVDVVADRAEKIEARFQAVTARAVARLATLVPLVAPLAAKSGVLLLVKGQRAEEELDEIRASLEGWGVAHERTVDTPTGRVVVLRKRA